jgi:hypothetical protein
MVRVLVNDEGGRRRSGSAKDRANYGKRHLNEEGTGRWRLLAVLVGGIGCEEHVQHNSSYGAGLDML